MARGREICTSFLVETGRDLEGAGEMDGEWRGYVNEEELKGVSATFHLRQSQPSNMDPTVK